MAKKKTKLQLAQERVAESIKKTNEQINLLGEESRGLHEKLNTMQIQFNAIRNMPNEKQNQYEKMKQIQTNWIQNVNEIEADFKASTIKGVGGGAAGVGAGVTVAALGPTAAMGIATTFGVASTGTAISTLSGAAATNAALAWLGGGALAAGGGGMVAGNALLALAGPVGWAIAGVAALGSGLILLKAKSKKARLENVFTLISERDVKSYELAIVELNERIIRIRNEKSLLDEAISKIQTFGVDYNQLSQEQQYELGSYVNLMEASTRLLVNPILGLLPKYTEADFKKFLSTQSIGIIAYCIRYKNTLINLSNLLYRVEIEEQDRQLLAEVLKNNKQFLKAMGIDKKSFDVEILYMTEKCLEYHYSQSSQN